MNIIKDRPKDVFIIIFPSSMQARYWKVAFVNKFAKDFVYMDKSKEKVELVDSVWYFLSENCPQQLRGLHGIQYGPEAIYIILDDFERTKLDSYEGV